MIFSTPQTTSQDIDVLGRIEEMRSAFRYSTSTPMRWYGLLRRNSLARAIQGSNSIEGYNVTNDDAIAIVEGAPPLDAESESYLNVMGYRNAMTYVLQLSKAPKFSYNDGFIRSLHFMMLSHDLTKNPGNWRPGPIYVHDEARNVRVYEGPPMEKLQTLMDEFVNSLNYAPSPHVIIKAAMAHLNLVMIHPFSDGNGRMARCLQTLVLARDRVLEPAFCSIEEYLGRNTQDYYSILGEVGKGFWNPQHDATPWIRFNIIAHFRQAATLARRMKILRRLWGELEAEIAKRKLPERTLVALAEAAIGHRVRNPIYRAQAEVSENVATRDLKALVDEGLLIPKGEKRGREYIASDFIKQVLATVYEPRVDEDPYETKPAQTMPMFAEDDDGA